MFLFGSRSQRYMEISMFLFGSLRSQRTFPISQSFVKGMEIESLEQKKLKVTWKSPCTFGKRWSMDVVPWASSMDVYSLDPRA